MKSPWVRLTLAALLGLGVGAEVRAVGSLRLTVLGLPMLEAHQVNRVVID